MKIKSAVFIFFCLLVSVDARSQCTFQINGLPCINNPIEFVSNTPGASNHNWNFNNEGFNNTSANPKFTFSGTGIKTITYSCLLADGQPCTISQQITIKDVPKLRLSLINNPVQCFETNMFCIRDSSLSGDNDKCIKTIKYLFSDGELITKYGSKNDPVNLPSTICKTFSDPQGGEYDLTVEIEDCNGCIYKQQLPFKMTVELLPSVFAISEEKTEKCKGSVQVKFTNLSLVNRSKITKFIWDFGDGSKDSTSWDSVFHTYTSGTKMTSSFFPKLIVYTGNGCSQVFELKDVIIYNFKPYIVKNKDSICVNEEITFELFPKELVEHIKVEKTRWDFNPGLDYGYKVTHHFSQIGPTLISLYLSHVCPHVLVDTVVVIGPKAVIEPEYIQTNERYQCQIQDTVHVADHSAFYHNDNDFLDDDSLYSEIPGNLKFKFRRDSLTGRLVTIRPYDYDRNDLHVSRLWDFGDNYCLPCTSDRKKNINTGLNCRYSQDSAEFHVYTDWDSVYHYLFAKKHFDLSYFSPDSLTCGKKRVWMTDSLYATIDSVLYYGDNNLGNSAKDSLLFKHIKHKVSIAAGLFGSGAYQAPHDMRIYIPANNSAVIANNGGSKILVNGPQYYAVSADQTISSGALDTVLFVYGLKVYYDTLPWLSIKPYHLQVKKVKINNFVFGDSINPALHRRFFYERIPQCFPIVLTRKDTVHPMRCESRATAYLALMPPSAKRFNASDNYCYTYDMKVVEFTLNDTKPGCMASFVKFNPDFKADSNDWHLLNDLNYGEMKRSYFTNPQPPYRGYEKEGPNSGLFHWLYKDEEIEKKNIQNIHVGLIIGNGTDGNFCADTLYYENFASFPRLSPELVFLESGTRQHHVCRDTTVFVSIPEHKPDHNKLVHESSWFIIHNQTADTLEKVHEFYRKVQDHPLYPGKKVNYTIIQRSRLVNGQLKIYREDTLVTAIVHRYKAIALPGAGLNGLKNDMARLGFDMYAYSDTVLFDFIWNRKGIIGNYASGSRGCIDTSGYGHLLRYYYLIDSSTLLSYKDTSLYPADSVGMNGNTYKAYGFKVKENGSYNIYRNVSSFHPSYCPLETWITVAVGFRAQVQFSDTIICQGRIIEAKPDFRYYSLDTFAFGNLDTLKHWLDRQNQAGSINREGVTIWDYSKEDDDKTKPSTIFGSAPYVKKGYGNPGILLGNETGGIYYRTPGIYTLRVVGIDSNLCTDTITQKIYVTGPKAGFYTDIITPNCKTILEFFDTSKIIDPCLAKGNDPCDFIYSWSINWGDGSPELFYTKQLPKQIGHDYTKNGYYRITLIIESVLGCRDTVSQDVYIPGPSPEFIAETKVKICVNDSVRFRNISKNYTASSQWLWNFGDGFYNPQTDTSAVTHQYTKTGVFDVYLSQFDSIANTGKYCAAIYPDQAKGQQKITVTVVAYDQVNLKAEPPVVCVGDSIAITANLITDHLYKLYNWTNNGQLFQTPSLVYKFAPNKKGAYHIFWSADTLGLNQAYCPDFDSILVFADSILADFTIDDSKKPLYCFTNESKWAVDYRWGFFHDTDITFRRLNFEANAMQSEPERYICQSFVNNYGANWVCLEAVNSRGCKDTICKFVYNDFDMVILPPNVFSPGDKDQFFGVDKDGKPGNDVFNIYAKNVTNYHLVIYDRWGVKVFESEESDYDWNGRVDNVGQECPDGTYYYILNYRYAGRDKNEPTLNGVVRLIRE